MLDADLKARWIAALRSGEYRQGTSLFEREDGSFCCLGVLCKAADQPTTIDHSGNWNFADEQVGAGISNRLARMNDSGKPFPEIADYIEKSL